MKTHSSSGKAKKKARAQQRRAGAGHGARPVLRAPAHGLPPNANPDKLQKQLQKAMRAGRLTPQQRQMCDTAQSMLRQLATGAGSEMPSPPAPAGGRPVLRPPRPAPTVLPTPDTDRPSAAPADGRPILRPPTLIH